MVAVGFPVSIVDLICIVELEPKEHEENVVGIVVDGMMVGHIYEDITTDFTLGTYSLNFPLPGKCVSNIRR